MLHSKGDAVAPATPQSLSITYFLVDAHSKAQGRYFPAKAYLGRNAHPNAKRAMEQLRIGANDFRTANKNRNISRDLSFVVDGDYVYFREIAA